jgi:hypothetical protein
MRLCGSASSRAGPRRQRNKSSGCDGPHAHRGAPRATISAVEEVRTLPASPRRSASG